MNPRGIAESEYLRWAKNASAARFNLSPSGVPSVSLRELPPVEVELNGTDPRGYEPLQRAIAERYRVPLECAVPTMGASMANHLAMAAVLQRGDEVLMERPVYEPLAAVASYLGATVRPFLRDPQTGFSLQAEKFERQIGPRARLIVVTNLHNPSSALASSEELRALGKVARAVGARVLVDEVYLGAVWDRPPSTAFHLGPEFVATGSLTKVYGLGGLRCGWVFAEPAIVQRIWRLTDLFNNIGAHPAERLSLAAMSRLDDLAARSRALLQANADTLNDFYASREELAAPAVRFGTVSFPRLRSGDVESLWKLLRVKYETSIVPGRFFGMSDHFRIGLGVPPDEFAAGLARVGHALDVLR